MKKTLLATILLVAFNYPAAAEGATHAMRGFGLVGTWSEDCADEKALRVIYAYPTFASPTITLSANNDRHGKGTLEVEVKSAIKVTDEKLKNDWRLHGKRRCACRQALGPLSKPL